MQLTTGDSVDRARAQLEAMRTALASAGVPGQLVLTGASSIEGLWTKGDIDLHLRVTERDFATAIELLPALLPIAHPDIWTPWFAVFERLTPPLGIAVTVIGSEHDLRFVRSWQRMADDPDARRRYNEVKLGGGNVEDAKSRFFDDLAR